MPSRTLAGSLALVGDWDLHEAGWKPGMDNNLLWLSVIVQGRALNKVAVEPGSPAEGDIYILDQTNVAHPNNLAVYDEAAWHYKAPLTGWNFYNIATGQFTQFDGAVWGNPAYKTYADTAVTSVMRLIGGIDCSANPNYPAATLGDTYVVTVAGRIGGGAGKQVDAGDAILATANNAGGTQAAVGASWDTIEHNLVGALLAANNLSDVANAATARDNIGAAPARLTIEAVAATAYAFVLADAGKHKRFTAATAIVATVPNGVFTAGDRIRITAAGAGTVTLTPAAGVTLNSRAGALASAGQYAVIEIECVAANVFDVLGDVQ
jgi:hypothetical protein